MNNLAKRTISGVAFVIVTLACLLLHPALYAVFALFVMSLMMAEFHRMAMGKEEYLLQRALAIFSAAILFILMFFHFGFGLPSRFISLAILPVIALMISSMFVKDKTDFAKFCNIYTGYLYIAVPISLSNMIVFRSGEFSGLLFVCFFIIIWCSDVGAYCVGTAFGQKPGRKKLCPDISPKKSWAGFWGGLFFAALAAVAMNYAGLVEFPLFHCVALGLIMNIGCVFGDLFESQWKRFYGIKDSGNIIPGHGGMMDRFDSALFAIPLGSVYLVSIGLI